MPIALDDLQQTLRRVEELDRKLATMEGRQAEILDQLKKEFQCPNLEAAREKLRLLQDKRLKAYNQYHKEKGKVEALLKAQEG